MFHDKIDSQLCVTSYNSTGFGQDKVDYIKTLLLFSDVLCLQEHFLLGSFDRKHSNTIKIRRAFGEDFDMYIVPAFKSNESISRGRGKGGLCTMWSKGLTKYVSKVDSKNNRVQATKFQFPSFSLLILNTYFMCDPQNDFDDVELYQLLAEIKRLIETAACDHLSLQGDLNCDFSRQTPFVQIVRDFCIELDIQPIFLNPDNESHSKVAQVSHTFCHLVENEARTSLVDHFVMNKGLYEEIIEAGSIQSVENLSWHDPIYCKIRLSNLDLQLEATEFKHRLSWNTASNQNKSDFADYLDICLDHINIPDCLVNCKDLRCKNHTRELNDYCEDLLSATAIDESAVETIPWTMLSKKRGNLLPG